MAFCFVLVGIKFCTQRSVSFTFAKLAGGCGMFLIEDACRRDFSLNKTKMSFDRKHTQSVAVVLTSALLFA